MDVHPTKNVSIGIDPYPNDDWQIFKPRTGRNGSRHPENDQNTAGKMTGKQVLGDELAMLFTSV